MSFNNCLFHVLDPRNVSKSPLIDSVEGRVAVQGNVFRNARPVTGPARDFVPVRLGPGIRSAIVERNEFYGPDEVANESRGGVVISNNLTGTGTV